MTAHALWAMGAFYHTRPTSSGSGHEDTQTRINISFYEMSELLRYFGVPYLWTFAAGLRRTLIPC
jgi:hypothetical protein